MSIKIIEYNGISGYARVMYNDVKEADKYHTEVAYEGKDIKALLEYLFELEERNKRLNNIINEFDKWLLGEQMMFYRSSDDERLIRYGETKNKWLELKGVDKE